MRFLAPILVAATLLASGSVCAASSHSSTNPWSKSPSQNDSSQHDSAPENCLTVAEVGKHVGKPNCVTGTVIHVENSNRGVTYLDFCAEYRTCPFSVIVFRGDLRKVGDVRQLQGHVVTIKGTIEEYDNRAEIILRHPRQLGPSAALLTPIPKDYDVERQGHYSAGSPKLAKAKKTKHSTQGAPVSLYDPEEP